MKTVFIFAKCSDMCNIEIVESKSRECVVYNGYSYDGSDYIDLGIDFDTGKVENWKVIREQCIKVCKGG